MDQPEVGALLLATPQLAGTFFGGTVIGLLDYDEHGALGLILNRLLTIPVDEHFPDWSEELAPPASLFHGGPVSENAAIALSRPRKSEEDPPGWNRIDGDFGTVNLKTPIEIVRGTYSDLRIFIGYSGWSAGQLDEEISDGSWFVVPGTLADFFSPTPDTLWRSVLRRQGGELSFFSTWTDTPGAN